jgi:hypothetical protein
MPRLFLSTGHRIPGFLPHAPNTIDLTKMLIVFGGLPGTGKTTLATGYEVAYALAIRRHIEAAARSTP